MTNKTRADFVAWLHFIWILFGLISLPILFIFTWWNKVVLTFTGLTVLSWIAFRGCWFLQLENKWRKQYNPSEAFENEAFIQHYLKKLFNINFSKIAIRTLIYLYMAIIIVISINQLIILQ